MDRYRGTQTTVQPLHREVYKSLPTVSEPKRIPPNDPANQIQQLCTALLGDDTYCLKISFIGTDFNPIISRTLGNREKVQLTLCYKDNADGSTSPLSVPVNIAMRLFNELHHLLGEKIFNELVCTRGLDLKEKPYIVFYADQLNAFGDILVMLQQRIGDEQAAAKADREMRFDHTDYIVDEINKAAAKMHSTLRQNFEQSGAGYAGAVKKEVNDIFTDFFTRTTENPDSISPARKELRQKLDSSKAEITFALVEELATLHGIFAGFFKRMEIDPGFQNEMASKMKIECQTGKFIEAFSKQDPSVQIKIFCHHINWHLSHQAQIENIYTLANPKDADQKLNDHHQVCGQIKALKGATKAAIFAHAWGEPTRSFYSNEAESFIQSLQPKLNHVDKKTFYENVSYEIRFMHFDRISQAAGKPARARGIVKSIAIKLGKSLFSDLKAYREFIRREKATFMLKIQDFAEYRMPETPDGKHYFLELAPPPPSSDNLPVKS